MTTPPLCSFEALKTTLTIDDLFDLLEAQDLKDHLSAKVAKQLESKHGSR